MFDRSPSVLSPPRTSARTFFMAEITSNAQDVVWSVTAGVELCQSIRRATIAKPSSKSPLLQDHLFEYCPISQRRVPDYKSHRRYHGLPEEQQQASSIR
ncbi:Hypothetical protein NTJ_14159 [Nesidiocoris tenuis]|nr:Hypothetical protein NTJ_14159 [Nesidiocoris tenuis]